jgi:hypothetical protein
LTITFFFSNKIKFVQQRYAFNTLDAFNLNTNIDQQSISFDGHKQEEVLWEKVIDAQNVEKFLNSPTGIVVKKERRKKTKQKQPRFTCLHLIDANAGLFLCTINLSQ